MKTVHNRSVLFYLVKRCGHDIENNNTYRNNNETLRTSRNATSLLSFCGYALNTFIFVLIISACITTVQSVGSSWVKQSSIPLNIQKEFKNFVENTGGNYQHFTFEGNLDFGKERPNLVEPSTFIATSLKRAFPSTYENTNAINSRSFRDPKALNPKFDSPSLNKPSITLGPTSTSFVSNSVKFPSTSSHVTHTSNKENLYKENIKNSVYNSKSVPLISRDTTVASQEKSISGKNVGGIVPNSFFLDIFDHSIPHDTPYHGQHRRTVNANLWKPGPIDVKKPSRTSSTRRNNNVVNSERIANQNSHQLFSPGFLDSYFDKSTVGNPASFKLTVPTSFISQKSSGEFGKNANSLKQDNNNQRHSKQMNIKSNARLHDNSDIRAIQPVQQSNFFSRIKNSQSFFDLNDHYHTKRDDTSRVGLPELENDSRNDIGYFSGSLNNNFNQNQLEIHSNSGFRPTFGPSRLFASVPDQRHPPFDRPLPGNHHDHSNTPLLNTGEPDIGDVTKRLTDATTREYLLQVSY